MKFLCSLLVVKDIKRSRELYEKVLGLQVKYDYGENITFDGDFAIHQEDHFKSLINSVDIIKKSNSFELYFEDDDLAKVQDKIENEGLEFLHKIEEQPWKQRVLRFYDYDKHLIEIGESMEHVAYRLSLENYSIDEIAKITYMPVEGVKSSIKEYSKS